MARNPLVSGLIAALLAAGAAFAPVAAPAQALPDTATIRDAWTYLVTRALVARQETIDRAADGFAFNEVRYNPLGSADFVNPNFDVAYLEAWIAVDDESYAVLEVPRIEGRYYTAQIIDEWGEVIANVNERTMPTRPSGRYALVAPGADPELPADMGRIELHSGKAKLLGRVELATDPEGAVALQRQFTLTPSGTPVVADPVPLRMFDNDTLIGVELFENVDALLASALDVSPRAAEMQEKARAVAARVASGPEGRAEVEAALAEIVPAFVADAATASGPYRNHWLGVTTAGNYGDAYFERAAANFVGIWANATDEVIYLIATRDSDEAPLDGSKSYVMHFPADRLPDAVVDGYWSVILVGVPDYRVVPNALGRYNFNSHSGLAREADGSLKIAVGPEPVAGVPESNRLPTAAGRRFSLTFRAYVPKDVVKAGEWQPPALTPVN